MDDKAYDMLNSGPLICSLLLFDFDHYFYFPHVGFLLLTGRGRRYGCTGFFSPFFPSIVVYQDCLAVSIQLIFLSHVSLIVEVKTCLMKLLVLLLLRAVIYSVCL